MSTGDAPEETEASSIRDALNSMCSPSIAVSAVRPAPATFHARFSALSRTYVYALLCSDIPDPFLAATTWWQRSALDVDAMDEAAGHLLGEHDFASFGRPPDDGGSTIRTLYELNCVRDGRIVRIKARAGSFIQQMVRSLVGTLVEVGQGKLGPEDLPAIVAARDRSTAGAVAPAHGLCLVAVEYPHDWATPEADDQGIGGRVDPSDQGSYPAVSLEGPLRAD